MSVEISVKSQSGSYPVFTGTGILEEKLTGWFGETGYNRCFLFVDENVWDHHQERISTLFNSLNTTYELFIVPPGEQSKSFEMWQKGIDFLMDNGVRRNTPLITIGGGITGDLSGFVASSAMRGIPLVHIPTTLLAMVDSSIGGKTGINHAAGKNLVGAFYSPQLVISDLDLLDTLPDREWVNGLSEILKYGAISNSEIFSLSKLFLEGDFKQIAKTKLALLVSTCAQIKAEIVQNDEHESGKRAYLNFGHTFAHAIEKACNFDVMSHGEAVFLGMLGAIELSNLTGSSINREQIYKYRKLYSFNVQKKDLDPAELTGYMQHDKKRSGRHLTFILLENWQHPVIKTVTSQGLIHKAWDKLLQEL